MYAGHGWSVSTVTTGDCTHSGGTGPSPGTGWTAPREGSSTNRPRTARRTTRGSRSTGRSRRSRWTERTRHCRSTGSTRWSRSTGSIARIGWTSSTSPRGQRMSGRVLDQPFHHAGRVVRQACPSGSPTRSSWARSRYRSGRSTGASGSSTKRSVGQARRGGELAICRCRLSCRMPMPQMAGREHHHQRPGPIRDGMPVRWAWWRARWRRASRPRLRG